MSEEFNRNDGRDSKLQTIVCVLVVLVVLALGYLVWPKMTRHAGGVYMGPSPIVETARALGLAMFSYANDHDGKYPTGKSSTEVFQKLIDEGYVTDPALFWNEGFKVLGKNKATSNKLKSENVCWDVTVPLDDKSDDNVPVVFSTGYRINYSPGGSAVPITPLSEHNSYGLAVCYHENNARWINNDRQPDGIVTNFIDTAFVPNGKKYQQLTPDGLLAP